MSGDGDTSARFEITYLDADDDHVTRTADAVEVRAIVAWAGEHGVKVRVRPCDNDPGVMTTPVRRRTPQLSHDGRSTMSEDNKDQPDPTVAKGERDLESWKERGVALRAFFYIFGTHVFAGFVWLLFYLGGHANK